MNITVLGDGAWGTALAILAQSKGHDVTLWGYFPDYIEQMKEKRENSQFLPGIILPDELNMTSDIADAVENAEIIIIAIPVKYMAGILQQKELSAIPDNAILVNVAKGIDTKTLKSPSDIIKESLGNVNYVAMSGPSHAEEVAEKMPTAVVAACADEQSAEQVQQALSTDFFRIYTTYDVVGVELGGALKNVFALAAGICDGMEFGDNSKAALITRGIAEMARLGKALGGDPSTFAGLSGVGDLIVTCMSRHSRNRYVGEALGSGQTLPDIESSMGLVVAEGVTTAKSVHQLAEEKAVSTPVIDEVYQVLYKGKEPAKAAHDLMTREPKQETPEV